ncbi:PotD/PotF family extracellular solute-binding protein [uncultured Clostridium sp.]|uniref:ABC transporter substrate-binding protein n=1 Tax=uncultured Clostridium sp. TaxID=59620 RepID=UPI0025FBE3D8|nr:spermidine/putrescine ABC transporter substrate-binding protein [uncultured Clostridium sp.]
MKKFLGVFLTVIILMTTFVGCGGSGGESGNTETGEANSADIGDTVNIMVWGDCISEEVYSDFEEKYGCHVNVSYVTNTDEMLAKLISGGSGLDLVHVESAYVKTFIEADVLDKINKENIPNEKYLKDSVYNGTDENDAPYIVSDGFDPGYTVLVYNKETCPGEINSFKDLADPKFKGQVSLPESTVSLFGTALAAIGYTPGTSNEDEIKAAYELLMKIKPNLKAMAGGSTSAMLLNGDVSVALMYERDWVTLMADPANRDKFDIAHMDGYEAGPVFWGIPKDAEHKEAAEALANFRIEPEEFAKSITTYPALPGLDMKYIEEFLSDSIKENPALETPDYVTSKAFYQTVTPEVVSTTDKYYTLFKS